MKVGIFSKADGSLASHYEGDAPNQANYGGPWGDPDQTVHLEIPGSMDARCVSATLIPEKWTKEGEPDVTVDPLDITYTHVPAYFEVVEDSAKKTELQQADAIFNTEQAVAKAIAFGNKLLTEFAGENIRLGITTDNMTGTVLTKMEKVMVAMQTGSLHEAIARAKAIPATDYDAKYVTEARLIAFINKIENYLGVTPLTADIHA